MFEKRDIREEVSELYRRTDALDACAERDSRSIVALTQRAREQEEQTKGAMILLGEYIGGYHRMADEIQSLRLISAVCLSVAACAVVTAICAVIA